MSFGSLTYSIETSTERIFRRRCRREAKARDGLGRNSELNSIAKFQFNKTAKSGHPTPRAG